MGIHIIASGGAVASMFLSTATWGKAATDLGGVGQHILAVRTDVSPLSQPSRRPAGAPTAGPAESKGDQPDFDLSIFFCRSFWIPFSTAAMFCSPPALIGAAPMYLGTETG